MHGWLLVTAPLSSAILAGLLRSAAPGRLAQGRFAAPLGGALVEVELGGSIPWVNVVLQLRHAWDA